MRRAAVGRVALPVVVAGPRGRRRGRGVHQRGRVRHRGRGRRHLRRHRVQPVGRERPRRREGPVRRQGLVVRVLEVLQVVMVVVVMVVRERGRRRLRYDRRALSVKLRIGIPTSISYVGRQECVLWTHLRLTYSFSGSTANCNITSILP